MAGLFRIASLVLCLLVVAPTRAAVQTELTVQHRQVHEPNRAQPAGDYGLSSGGLRLLYSGGAGPLSWQADYFLEAAYSDRWQALNAPTLPVPQPLFSLEDRISDGEDGVVRHRLDRLWLMHAGEQWVFKLGRQALTWGSGRVFRPMDLFNPFSPSAIDTRYKPGTDMLYAQRLFSSGADLQLIYLPRRAPDSDRFSHSDSSLAAKWLWFDDTVQYQFLLAGDYGDRVVAGAVALPVGEALASADLVMVRAESGERYWSAVGNIEYSWTVGDHPVTGVLEYFRNGFGDRAVGAISEQPLYLRERIARGQLFNTGRDYLAATLGVQTSPLWMMNSSLILNLNDQSAQLGLMLDHNLADDARMVLGGFLPLGPEGTEYGGLPLQAGLPVWVRPPPELFIRFEWYF